MENKTGKYFKYAIGEIVLVVIGILIALQINNWNENRKLKDVKQNYIQQILLDLEFDKNFAKEHINILDSSITKYNTYRATYNEPYTNFGKTLTNLGINNFFTKNLEFKTSTIKTLINTGDIKLLEPKLREKLSQYNANKIQTANLSANNNEAANNMYQEAMMNGAGTFLIIQSQPELKEYLAFDDRLPEIYLELDAYLSSRTFGEGETNKRLNKLIKEADILIDALLKHPKK